MLNIGYFKAQPTEHIIQYVSGRVAREGQGLAFFYLKHNTQVVAVPTSSLDANLLDPLGAELLNVTFISAKPTPEVAKALEADYRETLVRKADMAIYARRAAAVEEERKIKENELSTDIALEEQRRRLIDLQGENSLREAEGRGKALEEEARHRAKAKQMELEVYGALEPRKVLALALNELGQNAGRIANLTITSEVLAGLLNGRAADAPVSPDQE
jgi:hypothetical protein